MAQLNGLIVSDDEEFVSGIARRLRSGAVSVRMIDEHAAAQGAVPDLVIVDIRFSQAAAMPAIEQLRAKWPNTGIFAIAAAVDADLVIQSMRAGANEFFAWPPPTETFDEALRRTAARRAAAPSTATQATTMVFFGAKGGAGTTTLAVNCAVEIARQKKRPTLIVDLKAGLGEVTLFLGVRSRYTMLDALDNLHRLDQEFIKELVVKHKSGLEILAGSDLFDRPSASDSGGLEEVFRLLGRQYEYIIVDAGAQMNACAVATLYTADTIFLVANPDVPSVRNAQRLLDRIGQLGASGDRVRVLLNRAAEPYPIPPQQIESALGHPISQIFLSDYKTVSTALNSGVPLATAGNSDLASQFDSFARRLLDPTAVEQEAAPVKRGPLPLGLQRLASMW
jgi:pilus assembly protein CpaE